MSVVKGKVIKAKATFQQQGTKGKNNKFNGNQKNKQSPSIKSMKDKIKNGVQAENFSDSVVFSPKITKKFASKQQKPLQKTETTLKTSKKGAGDFVKTSPGAINVNKKFTGSKPKTGPLAPEKSPTPQAQNLKGNTKHTGPTKDFGKKGQALKSAKRRERRNKNLDKDTYNQKLQNAFWEADTNKTERSLMERNSKKGGIKNVQVPVDIDSDESDQSDYEVEHAVKADKIAKKLSTKEKSDSEDEESDDEVMGSDIADEEMESDAEDQEMESDDAEEEEAEDDDSEDDEEMESDVEDEEIGSDVEDEAEIESDNGEDEKSANELESEDMIPLTMPNKKKLNLLDKVQDKESVKKAKKENSNQGQADEHKKASRYVLFVGNLSFNIDEPTIRKHFEKAGEVRDIRIMTEKGTNKPRGFGFVELSDSECYQKALSLHHSMLSGRRINVERATGHAKDPQAQKKEVAKSLKLYAMRKKGMLAGSTKPKDNRNARKNKAKGMSKGAPETK